jgi:hypothetical protein
MAVDESAPATPASVMEPQEIGRGLESLSLVSIGTGISCRIDTTSLANPLDDANGQETWRDLAEERVLFSPQSSTPMNGLAIAYTFLNTGHQGPLVSTAYTLLHHIQIAKTSGQHTAFPGWNAAAGRARHQSLFSGSVGSLSELQSSPSGVRTHHLNIVRDISKWERGQAEYCLALLEHLKYI